MGFGLGPGFDSEDLRADTIPLASPPPPAAAAGLKPGLVLLCCLQRTRNTVQYGKSRESQMAVSCIPSCLNAYLFRGGLAVIIPLSLTSFPLLTPQCAVVTRDHRAHTCAWPLQLRFALCFVVLLRSTEHAQPCRVHLVIATGLCLQPTTVSVATPPPLLPDPPLIIKGVASVGKTEANHPAAPNVWTPKCFIQKQTTCFLLCKEPLGPNSQAPGFCSVPSGCILKNNNNKKGACLPHCNLCPSQSLSCPRLCLLDILYF